MSIRLGNSCRNCEKYKDGFCLLHRTAVEAGFTHDSFEMRAALKDDTNCVNCRCETPDSDSPQKAAPGMLCSHWTPNASA